MARAPPHEFAVGDELETVRILVGNSPIKD